MTVWLFHGPSLIELISQEASVSAGLVYISQGYGGKHRLNSGVKRTQ